MRQTTGTRKSPGEKIVKDIKRATRKQYCQRSGRGLLRVTANDLPDVAKGAGM